MTWKLLQTYISYNYIPLLLVSLYLLNVTNHLTAQCIAQTILLVSSSPVLSLSLFDHLFVSCINSLG